MNILGVVVAMLMTFGLSNSANATVWTIDEVLTGSSGGFGFSGFHVATPGSPMSGASLGTLTGGAGTFDDITGVLDATLTGSDTDGPLVVNLDSAFSPVGNLIFDIGGTELLLPIGAALFAEFTTGGTALVDATFWFGDGVQCCSGAEAPNSFVISGTTAVMSLWGWTGGGPGGHLGIDQGIDLKITFTSVPTPPALSLLGLGLLIVGIRRSRKINAA